MSSLVTNNIRLVSEKITLVAATLDHLTSKSNILIDEIENSERFVSSQKEENTINYSEHLKYHRNLKSYRTYSLIFFLIILFFYGYSLYNSNSNYDISPSDKIIRFLIFLGVLWALGVLIEKYFVKKVNTSAENYNIDLSSVRKVDNELIHKRHKLNDLLDDKKKCELHLEALKIAKEFQNNYQVYKVSDELDNILNLNQSKFKIEYLEKIIRLRSYINKSQDVYLASIASFGNLITNSSSNHSINSMLEYIIQIESTLKKSYLLSVKMLEFYLKEDLMSFFKIYNGFEELGIFSSAAEKKMISSIEELNDIVGSGFASLIDKISDLDHSISDGLSSIESSIDWKSF